MNTEPISGNFHNLEKSIDFRCIFAQDEKFKCLLRFLSILNKFDHFATFCIVGSGYLVSAGLTT